METSIADIHKAMQAGTLTCHNLVQQYLDRIHAYDQQGPAINSMLYINPASLEQADALIRLSAYHKLKLLVHPIVLKDNFDTADMLRPRAPSRLKVRSLKKTLSRSNGCAKLVQSFWAKPTCRNCQRRYIR